MHYCPLFEFALQMITQNAALSSAVEFSGVWLLSSTLAMTGLLSVFSLLPVQALKKRNDDEGRFDEGDGTHTTLAGGIKLSIGEDEESSDKDTERYHSPFFATLHKNDLDICFYSRLKPTTMYFFIVYGLKYFSFFFRNLLLKANKKLSQVLVDVLKTTAAAEKTLGLHMQSLRDTSAEVQPSLSSMQRENTEPKTRYSSGKYQHLKMVLVIEVLFLKAGARVKV